MADQQRNDRDVGSGSPASREAQQQGMSGERGAEAGQTRGMEAQPPQGSGRSPAARHNQEPEARKGFEPGHAPSEQGEKDHPSPHVVAQHQQGAEPRSGNHAAQADRSEEEANRGRAGGEHSRAGHGRENLPGDRH